MLGPHRGPVNPFLGIILLLLTIPRNRADFACEAGILGRERSSVPNAGSGDHHREEQGQDHGTECAEHFGGSGASARLVLPTRNRCSPAPRASPEDRQAEFSAIRGEADGRSPPLLPQRSFGGAKMRTRSSESNRPEPETHQTHPTTGIQDQDTGRSPASHPRRRSRPRAVPLREELCEICRDTSGRPDLAAALLLQQLQHAQQGVRDIDQYVAEEEGRAAQYPRPARACASGWLKRSAAGLRKDLFETLSETAVRDAMRRLENLGILLVRHGQNPWDRTRELRLDMVRLAELLAAQGRLPDARWEALGLRFPAVWPLSQPCDRGHNGCAGPSAGDGDPSALGVDGSAPCAGLDPRQPRVLSSDIEKGTDQKENPLNPPASQGDLLASLSSPPAILGAQRESVRMLPRRVSQEAAMEFVARAPIAAVFESIFRGRGFAWTPGFARKFVKAVKSGRITLPRLLAGIVSNSYDWGSPEAFISAGGHQTAVEDLHNTVRQLAEDIVRADPHALDLPHDLTHLRTASVDDQKAEILSATIRAQRRLDENQGSIPDALVSLQPSLAGIGPFTGFIVAAMACRDPDVPPKPDGWDRFRPWLIKIAARQSVARDMLLAAPPGRLEAVFGITGAEIDEARQSWVERRVREFQRAEVVRQAITSADDHGRNPSRPNRAVTPPREARSGGFKERHER